jgi:hypothetical protein
LQEAVTVVAERLVITRLINANATATPKGFVFITKESRLPRARLKGTALDQARLGEKSRFGQRSNCTTINACFRG